MPETVRLAMLPPTRRAIILSLKRRGEARAEELAGDLGITASGVRQHLSGLVAAGLVGHRELRSGPGRPKHVYSLTAGSEALFPSAYGDLVGDVLGFVEVEDPALLRRFFDHRREGRIERARARLAGKESLADQVAEVARILDEDGYLADWDRLDQGSFRITEHHCAVLAVARRHATACSTELEFLRAVLPGAEVERTAHIVAGAPRCGYHVTPRREP